MAESVRALASEVDRRLRESARPHRAGSVDGHSTTTLRVLGTIVPDLRALVKEVAKRIKQEDAAFVVELAKRAAHAGTLEARQVAYELLGRRADARALLKTRDIEALGKGNDNWKSVDVFGCEVTGPCWKAGALSDAAIKRWAKSKDHWWRRTALVSTIPFNMKSRGGTGDVDRTLLICRLLAHDREDMVVKAMSWALRELLEREPEAVRSFLAETELAPRVVREVTRKLDTGKKNR